MGKVIIQKSKGAFMPDGIVPKGNRKQGRQKNATSGIGKKRERKGSREGPLCADRRVGGK